MTKISMSILNDFQAFLRLERSLSENTISSYTSDLKKIFSLLEEKGINDIRTINSDDIVACINAESTKSPRTLARMISAMKSLFKFLEMEGVIDVNPCDLIDLPKISSSLPVVLTVKEIQKIIDAVDLSEDQGHRNQAIIELLYSCGLRVSELTNLKLSDLFFDESFIRVIGKGNKQRLIPIGEPAIRAIDLYLGKSKRRYSSSTEDIVFLNRRGKKLSREMIFLIVKKYTSRAGIDKDVSPHTFRHSFATHLVENKADLRMVQEMLGHESILTTEIYTHVDSLRLAKTILEHHPRK